MEPNKVFSEDEIKMIHRLKLEIATIHGAHATGGSGGYDKGFRAHNDAWLYAGGFFASLFHYEQPKDIDFFIFQPNETRKATTATNWFKSVFNNEGFHKTKAVKQESAYRYKINPHIKEVWYHEPSKIQYIFTDYKSREELLNSFDYVHARVNYYQNDLYISRKMYNAIRDKTLVVNNQAAVRDYREKKFIGRGWKKEEPSILDHLGRKIWNVSNTMGLANTNTWSASLKTARMITPTTHVSSTKLISNPLMLNDLTA
jgi:hypothetical protein